MSAEPLFPDPPRFYYPANSLLLETEGHLKSWWFRLRAQLLPEAGEGLIEQV